MKWFRDSSNKLAKAERDVAFVTCYVASLDFAFPKDFDLAQFNLVLCESLYQGSGTRVYLYWKLEARARIQEPRVRKILGLPEPESSGAIVQVLLPKDPKWTRDPTRWGKWLLTAAALFGALSVIRDNFAEFLFPPNVSIYVADSTPSTYHAGTQLSIPLIIRNGIGSVRRTFDYSLPFWNAFRQRLLRLRGTLPRLRATRLRI